MFNHPKAKRFKLFLSMLMMAACSIKTAYAQDFSHDGNRWYEIEISIFSNQVLDSPDAEIEIPERTLLRYPNDIKNLHPAISSFLYEFDHAPMPTADFEPQSGIDSLWTELPTQEPDLGPEYSPTKKAFRVSNFDSDAFIALSPDHQQFDRINAKINGAAEHRLLYHSVWRQPVLNRVQSSAIFISGGESYGAHNELEGSVRISYNINRIDVDTDLWLSKFSSNIDQEESIWDVPLPPFANPQPETLTSSINALQIEEQLLLLESVAHMKELRSMRSSTFHYIDHPAFGLIIEIRPYQLPENSSSTTTMNGSFE